MTALFADLVGSTALAERLDPEELKLVVGDAIAGIVGAVEAFGGTVKDLAGDGVLAVRRPRRPRGRPGARAPRVAPDRRGSVRRRGPPRLGRRRVRRPRRRRVRSGRRRRRGRRLPRGVRAVGDAVNVAARLQAQADPGTVLVGDGTAERAEASFDWGPSRALDLKGKEDVVAARTLLAHTAATAASRGIEGVQAPIVGRDRGSRRSASSRTRPSPAPARSCSSPASRGSGRRG